jgi:hypothetical protein
LNRKEKKKVKKGKSRGNHQQPADYELRDAEGPQGTLVGVEADQQAA